MIYRVVREYRQYRYGNVTDTLSRHATKIEAVQAVRKAVKSWRRENRGTAWKLDGQDFGYQLLLRQQPVSKLMVVAESR